MADLLRGWGFRFREEGPNFSFARGLMGEKKDFRGENGFDFKGGEVSSKGVAG